ncbi:MAG TPA: YihY/virulence factor BrkB family protein [Thermomicrobiales bacterium]|nr:YihY/virulence factor BrkB family protein [Thermomicrobiales bacterium]
MHIPGFADLEPWDVVKGAVKSFLDDDMITYAAALSFHLTLALFPFIIFLLTLLGALGLSDFFDRVLVQAQAALPPDAYELLARVIGEIRGQPREGLLSVSILFAVWAASTGMRSVMNALNAAYDVEETRPAWKRYPLSIIYTIGLVAVVIAAAVFRLIGPWAAQRFANQLGLTTAVAKVWTWLRWPVVVLLLLLVVALIYYLGPNISQPFRYVTPGSVSAVVVWILASIGFSLYVENFGNYGATYGSLGGMVVLLLYFFVSAAVLLFGAEVNAVIHPAHGPRSENVTPGQ